MSISTRIQELRENNGLSQEQLAEQLNISRQAVSKWESEQANPDINNIISLSEIFNVSIDYLLTGKESQIIIENNKEQTPKKWGYHDILKMFLVIFGILCVAFGAGLLAKFLISLKP